MDHSEVKYLQAAVLDADSRFLLAMADLIEDRGLTKNDCGNYGRGFCLIGALTYIRGKRLHGDGDTVHHRISEAVGTNRIHDWNNVPSRTKDEVIAMLRAVAFSS